MGRYLRKTGDERVRAATLDDAEAITAIYAGLRRHDHLVRTEAALDDMRGRIASR